MLKLMRFVLLCMLELWRVGSICCRCWRCLEVMRRVLLCMPEAVEGELCLLEVLEFLYVLKVTRCVRCGK